MKTVEYRSTGISAISLLGVVFVTLKLTGHITWSWLWVLAPFWWPLAVVGVVLVFALICAIAEALLD